MINISHKYIYFPPQNETRNILMFSKLIIFVIEKTCWDIKDMNDSEYTSIIYCILLVVILKSKETMKLVKYLEY